MKRIFGEPLLHFLVLGAALFIAYGLLAHPGSENESRVIVVTQGQIENLSASFAKIWRRPPTAEELSGLVRDQVREEVYYREALALGLDRDDIVIRRRLRQKMEFISQDVAAQDEPSDADLNAYLQAHPDSFRVEPRLTFTQVYLNPQKRGGKLAHEAAQMLEVLRRSDDKVDSDTMGDSNLIPSRYVDIPASEIQTLFGPKFSDRLLELAPGPWQGPIESGYGVHLVRITERSAGRLPALSEVREKVRREWDDAHRRKANEKFYQVLLKRYSVTIEGPDKPSGKMPLSGTGH